MSSGRTLILAAALVMAIAPASSARDQSGDNWYFGTNGGVTFVNGTPEPLTGGQINQTEGCASISDSSGNLLFYTDGISVWNASHSVMPNGTSLKGNPSATQSAVVAPKPGDSNTFYIFTVPAIGSEDGLNYTVVDMTLDSGNGDVVSEQKNINLMATCSEEVTATVHANGTDIWVLARPYGSNQFHAFLVTSSGVNETPVISSAGTATSVGGSIGYLKASPTGDKLGMAYYYGATAEVYDFDASTGQVSNAVNLGMIPNAYGLEFSQDGALMYVTSSGTVYQFDLTAGDIPGSRVEICTISTGWAMQLAPDGKIYIVRMSQSALGVINSPNTVGTDCGCTQDGPTISGTGQLGLPTFIQSFFAASADFSTAENTPLDFAQDDFATPYNDTTTETLAQVKFTSVPDNGTLTIDGTEVAANDEALVAELDTLVYTPDDYFNGSDSFTWEGNSGEDYNFNGTFTVEVTPVAQQPSVTLPTGAVIGTQTTNGLVVSRNANDGTEVSHFKITGITGGTLYLNDGTTKVSNGDFITAAQGTAGLKFTPSGESCGFTIAGATSASDDDVSASTRNVSFSATPDAPVVTTTAISAIETDSATSGGNVTDDGGGTISARGVCWSTSSGPTTDDDKTTDGTGTGSFESDITGLTHSTKYYVRAYATNGAGTSYGDEVSFTTTAAMAPTVTTADISEITATTATAGGTVTDDGDDTVTARGVCWSTSEEPTVDDNTTEDGTGTGAFTSEITGLTADTAYYVRAYATNSVGTSYGEAVSFTTDEETAAPDLRVTVSATGQSANVGDEVTFQVNVENVGDGNATSVVLRFPLPSGTTFVGAWLVTEQEAQSQPLEAEVEDDEIVVSIGDVAAAEGKVLEIVLESNAAGTVTLQASATSAEQTDAVTAQANSEVEDEYWQIVQTTTPVGLCGMFGFVSPMLLMIGMIALKRQVRRP